MSINQEGELAASISTPAVDRSTMFYVAATKKWGFKDDTGTASYFSTAVGGDVTERDASTGILTGGDLSIGSPNTTFTIADGTGQIVDNDGVLTSVSWTGKTNVAVTNIATQNITFVSIDSAGSVVQSATRWTNAISRTEIILGVVIHVNRTVVDAVNQEHHYALHAVNQLSDLYEALGFFNITGNIFSANGANLNIDKSLGTISAQGSNYTTDKNNPSELSLAVLTGLTFQYRYSDGSNGVTGIAIDPDNLDNGAGGLTALANNKFSVQRIYSFTSNNVKIQRGVESFDNLDAALSGITAEAYVPEASIVANGLLRGFLICQKGETDLTNARFLAASKFGDTSIGGGGGVLTTLQGAYDNSSTPEIVVDAVNGGISIQDNSTPIGTPLLEVQANGGGTTYFDLSVAYTASNNPVTVNGTGAPTTDASLEIKGTDGAFLPPTLTTTQRDLLTPTAGMQVYNSTTGTMQNYVSAAWSDMGGGGGGGDVTGPASSIDNQIARFDSTTGKLLQAYTSGGPTISDTGVLSAPDDLYVNSFRMGGGATPSYVTGAGSTSIGADSYAKSTNSVALGYLARTTSSNSTSLGAYTYGKGGAVCIGYNASGGISSTVIGDNAYAYNIDNAISLGSYAKVYAANEMAVGGSAQFRVTNAYFGQGVKQAGTYDFGLNGTGGLGTDISAGNFYINGGKGTGTGLGGHLIFQTAEAGTTGSVQNSLVTHLEITDDGNVIMANLPTSAAGLPTGALWNNSGVMNIA